MTPKKLYSKAVNTLRPSKAEMQRRFAKQDEEDAPAKAAAEKMAAFNINKYGAKKAYEMACDARRDDPKSDNGLIGKVNKFHRQLLLSAYRKESK